ncbi:MAG: arginine decarboxylase, pyruvoyl-dependent [Clostridia bacterium]|nr:arginine decarboxylase, pyruvoyl-dependent [Clostridia bacterium]
MLPIPTRFALVSGAAEGREPLTAFDAALLAAGVGDVNLLKVSSILPPGCREVERIPLPPGALVPIAYGAIRSTERGARLAAAVAVGLGAPGKPGVIVEHTLRGSREDAERIVRGMVVEAFANRLRGEPSEIRVASAEHVVERTGCAFAGVVLWYD